MRISYAVAYRLSKICVLAGLLLASALPVSGGRHGPETVTDLLGAALPAMDQTVDVSGYYASGGPGGGEFHWDPECPKSSYNGGTVISPTVPWDGPPGASHLAFLHRVSANPTPRGHGCWKRPADDEVRFTEWGGRGDWNGSGAGHGQSANLAAYTRACCSGASSQGPTPRSGLCQRLLVRQHGGRQPL